MVTKRRLILEDILEKFRKAEIVPRVVYWHDFPVEYKEDILDVRDLREMEVANNYTYDSKLDVVVTIIKQTQDPLAESEEIIEKCKKVIKSELNLYIHNIDTINNEKRIKTSGKLHCFIKFTFTIYYRDDYKGAL